MVPMAASGHSSHRPHSHLLGVWPRQCLAWTRLLATWRPADGSLHVLGRVLENVGCRPVLCWSPNDEASDRQLALGRGSRSERGAVSGDAHLARRAVEGTQSFPGHRGAADLVAVDLRD